MVRSHEELLAAARSTLLGPAVTRGFHGTDVVLDDGDLLVAFRWRRHPRQFQVRLPLGDLRHGLWTGLPTATAREWVHEAAGLLMEELDTGATQWALRRERDGRIELDLQAGPPSRSAYQIGRAHASAAGWLAQQGLDVDAAVTAERRGSLRVWLQMYVDNASGEPVVAHLVVVEGATPATAEVTSLQVLADVPLDGLVRLAHVGLCAAAEAGAERITCAFRHDALIAAGMTAAPGELWLDARAPWDVPHALRTGR